MDISLSNPEPKSNATHPKETNGVDPNTSDEKAESSKKEVLIAGNYYDVTKWSKFHPGGRVINYYTESGEDATIAFLQFHNRSMKRVLRIRDTLTHRPAVVDEGNEVQQRNHILNQEFQKLHDAFEQEGLFQPSLSHVIIRVCEFFLYLFIATYLLQSEIANFYPVVRALGIVFLATAYGRIVWLAHEGGHNALIGVPRLDAYLQKFLYGFGNGLSASWWNHNHHKHHSMPQRIHRDIDLDTLPLLAFTAKCFRGKNEICKSNFLVINQAVLFLPLHTFLVALRWSVDLHPKYCYRKGEYFELFAIFCHFLFATTQIGMINFLIAKWLWSMYMFGNFSVSHTHLEVAEGPRHWVEYAFEHTINVKSSPFMDWWMGYLNFQIEHHLFPSMGGFRGPEIRERVKEFAIRNNLPYQELGYWEAVRATLNNLWKVAEEAEKIKGE